MTIEKVLEFTFGLIKKCPKIILPNVLNWIPPALLTILIFQSLNTISQWLTYETFRQMLTSSTFLLEIIKPILVYIVIAIPIVIASAVISLMLVCVYSDITRQAYRKNKILLTQSFSVAKLKFLPLSWTYFLEFLIVALIFGCLVVLGFVGKIIGIIFAIIIGIIVISLTVIFFYETPAIVVLENKSGFEAIKRSCSIAKHNFWSLLIVVLIVWLITTILYFINSSLKGVPYIGLILFNVVGLFLSTWNFMIPAIFYYEYEKRCEQDV